MDKELKIIECPRDALQGMVDFVPTEKKVSYINQLLLCNFDTIDFGSFVSPKAIPQMRDTADVLSQLDLSSSNSKLLAIIANERGAEDACTFDEINYLGYPFSVSEEFQKRNTNSTIEETLSRVEFIQNNCILSNKKLVIYLSMGFGNPYGEKWSPELVLTWTERLVTLFGIDIIAISDTIGSAKKEDIKFLYEILIPELPQIEFGAHMHVRPENAKEIIQTAFDAGCRRFDGAIRGFGGCPMAKDDLTGNVPTEIMLDYFQENSIPTSIDMQSFENAMKVSTSIF
ncbi:MAG: hydroxymethylglutaryl-CoA lyase [Bacteroidota bacterium]